MHTRGFCSLSLSLNTDFVLRKLQTTHRPKFRSALQSKKGSHMHKRPHWIFLKQWLHSTTELIQQPQSADKRSIPSHCPSQRTHSPPALQWAAPERGAGRNSPWQRVSFSETGERIASFQDDDLAYQSHVVSV